MLTDTLKRDVPNLQFPEGTLPGKIKDAIVFYVDQEAFDFGCIKAGQKKDFLDVLPTELPYNNILLQLKDGVLWMVCGEGLIFSYLFFGSRRFNMPDYPSDFYIEYYTTTKYDVDTRIVTDNSAYTSPRLERAAGSFDTVEGSFDMADMMKLMGQIISSIIHQFLKVLSCKNIRTVKIHGAPKRKKHKKPLHSYYILQIGDRVKSAKGKAKNIWSNRVHLCMGHIKTYTKEKPLFGHYVGNVWCPPHARGNRSKGVVHKDYAL